jgi:hypothetical protein
LTTAQTKLPNVARLAFRALLLLIVFATTSMSEAQTITGTVQNGTTNKLQAGDDVVLLKLGQGMEEGGRTKSDAKGAFTFKLDDAGSPHLIRVIHQGVTYHAMAPPGTPSVDVKVYDVGKKVEGISVTADVMRFQAQGGELQGMRLFAVDNNSNPPRTQMNDANFEFYLPEGAQIDNGVARTANGQPINSAPVPQKEKNRYAYIFPLRPGETQLEVAFHMPYKGSAQIDPRPLYTSQHLVVMLPKSMQFSAGDNASSTFQSMADPSNSNSQVEVASNAHAGQDLGFKISGTGVLESRRGGEGGDASAEGAPQGRDSRPGGGLGPPIDAPDPLERYRFYILGGFALVLTVGAIYIARRPRAASIPNFGPADNAVPLPLPQASKPTEPNRSAILLDALKEEIFQLELDRKRGQITQQQYDTAKAGLDLALERALRVEQKSAR